MFKESFKYYKSRKPPPDFNQVLDFNSLSNVNHTKVTKVNVEATSDKGLFGLRPVADWEVYEIDDKAGLIFIKNPFTELGGRYWVTRSLRDYTKKPNRLNIDAHGLIPCEEEWWDYCKKDSSVLKKLRWSTLGYHHDWDTKVYSEESKNEFPEDLAMMSSYMAENLKFFNFVAEAAIVNFYHLDSTLSGHTDHSEQNLDAPLFSISFGNSAIFLIGGETIEEKPTALMLHHGDIIVMSKASRLCYHGVPRILDTWTDQECDLPPDDLPIGSGDFCKDAVDLCASAEAWKVFRDYLRTSRINVNVRQVLKCGQKRLIDD